MGSEDDIVSRRRLLTPFTVLANDLEILSGTNAELPTKHRALASTLSEPETMAQMELPKVSANLQTNLWWIIPASCITQVLWILFGLILRRVCMRPCCAETASKDFVKKNRVN